MLPWSHFPVAAVPVTAYIWWQDRQFPTAKSLFIVGVGSQFPDLIDKPLAHQFFLLPSGRVGAHSLPIAIPIAIVALYVAWKLNPRRAGAVFVFAYASHIVADYYKLLVRPNPKSPTGLFWPLVPPVPGRLEPRWAGPGSINAKLWTVFSVVVLVVALYLVIAAYRAESGSRLPVS